MFKKLRARIARIAPFLRWVAADLKKGDVESAKQKLVTEAKETLNEIDDVNK